MLSKLLPLLKAQTHCNPSFGPCASGTQQLADLILRFIGLAGGIAFMIVTIMLVYAAIRFILSGGESSKIQQARNVAVYAVIGLVLLAVAWLILLLIQSTTGVCTTKFTISFQGTNC
jgi:heme/copper-type cytochrome/quinol oxidase subunit 2